MLKNLFNNFNEELVIFTNLLVACVKGVQLSPSHAQ